MRRSCWQRVQQQRSGNSGQSVTQTSLGPQVNALNDRNRRLAWDQLAFAWEIDGARPCGVSNTGVASLNLIRYRTSQAPSEFPSEQLYTPTSARSQSGCCILYWLQLLIRDVDDVIQCLVAAVQATEHPFSSDRQHLSYDGCLEVRGEIIRTVLCCIVYWSCAQS